MVVALTPPVDGLLAQNTADEGDGATVAQVGNGGPGQVYLAHQLALKPHLPLLVRHLSQGIEGDAAAGDHQGIEGSDLLEERPDGGGVAHVHSGIPLAVTDPDHLVILGKQFADGGANGAGGTHNHNLHIYRSWLRLVDDSGIKREKKRL